MTILITLINLTLTTCLEPLVVKKKVVWNNNKQTIDGITNKSQKVCLERQYAKLAQNVQNNNLQRNRLKHLQKQIHNENFVNFAKKIGPQQQFARKLSRTNILKRGFTERQFAKFTRNCSTSEFAKQFLATICKI